MASAFPALLAASLLVVAPRTFGQGSFTIQVGSPAPLPVTVVPHGSAWRYHEGTNAPVVGWQTNAEATLDETWLSGAGGFGYADNAPELAHVQTRLGAMQNSYTTFYLRKSFEITNAVNAATSLQLVMDWDDGFVAWLDGVELSPRMNAPGAAGSEPGVMAVATASHESSLGNNSPQPILTFPLGPVGDRLQPGTHVLAVLGLNQAASSSDFILIPDLLLGGAADSDVVNGSFLTIVHSNSVALSGTNSIPGAARVLVNGAEAAFDQFAQAWSCTVRLNPGFNRLLLQVLDAGGAQLLATNKDIVAELSSAYLGGALSGSTSLTSDQGVFHVTNSIRLAPGGSLSIGPGCMILLSPGANILVTNANLSVAGSETAPVVFGPEDGTSVWGGFVCSGVNARIRAQHVETIAGHLELFDGAQAVVEDGYFHDYAVSSPAIIHTLGQPNHCTLSLSRCHVSRYYEILCQLSTNRFEDCLMEYQAQGGDGIDFDGGQPGSLVRRCTVRHGKFTNVDALDMGEFATGEPSRGVLIDSCLLYDFVDKGISMGVQVDVTVTNCLMHHLDSGIAVKDSSTAGVYGCTIANNNFGFHCYNKANPSSPSGGGFITNSFNNILWDNAASVSLANGSTLNASYSDFEGTNIPGPGNISLDPLWVNPAAVDYSLSASSPAISAGAAGKTMGASFPVGAVMASSHPQISAIEVLGTNAVMRFWADSERSYSVLSSDRLAGPWSKRADIFTAPVPHKVSLTNSISIETGHFYRLVTPQMP